MWRSTGEFEAPRCELNLLVEVYLKVNAGLTVCGAPRRCAVSEELLPGIDRDALAPLIVTTAPARRRLRKSDA